jgi:hypothetical protein
MITQRVRFQLCLFMLLFFRDGSCQNYTVGEYLASAEQKAIDISYNAGAHGRGQTVRVFVFSKHLFPFVSPQMATPES